MKSVFTLLTVLFIGLLSCQAQYTQPVRDSLTQQTYTRAQIRQLLLKSEDRTEVYFLARKSRRSTTWSVVLYTVGAFYMAGGVSALVEMARDDEPQTIGESVADAVLPYAAAIGFGVGSLGVGLGIWQTRRAQKKAQPGSGALQ